MRFIITFSWCMFLLAAAVSAQINPEQAVISAQNQSFDIKNRSIALERMKSEALRRPIAENYRLNFSQIKQDFESIQKLNANVLGQTSVIQANLRPISKLAAEIGHRAQRLSSNLFPNDPEFEKQLKLVRANSANTSDAKLLVHGLDAAVSGFVHSPIFRNLNVFSASDLLKAQKQLASVVAFSTALETAAKQ